MSIFFQNPFWLLGALIAVPVLAHLFSRTRPKNRDFPSLRLLREAQRRVTRMRRPQDRWLLILRTLAAAAFVAAVLQPMLLSQFSSRGGGAKTVVIVVDSTASMGFVDGTRTRLAQASAAAEDVLATLPAGSLANVLWLRANAEPVLPEPGPNFDFLRQMLRKGAVRPEAGDPRAALALALKQLAGAEGARELVVCSDFQGVQWRDFDWALPPGVGLTRIATGSGDGANAAVAGLSIEPARPVAGQEARIMCRVRNFSGELRRVTVFAEAGESRLSQVVELAPWAETPAFMTVRFPQEATVAVRATVGEDRFPGDDTDYALADVRGALQVVIAGLPDDPTARIWERAAGSLDAVAVRRIGIGELATAQGADLLLVAGWRGESPELLVAHCARGGALVVQPAEGFDPAAGKELGVAPGAPLADERKDAPGWTLRIAAEDHPVFAVFAAGAYGDPAAAQFTRRAALPALAGKDARALLAYDDGQPAVVLLDLPAGGSAKSAVVWWSPDLGNSDWPTRAAFVPFFGELLKYLAVRVAGLEQESFVAGDRLRFDAGAAVPADKVRLVNERDEEIAIAPESARSTRLASLEPAGPGSYRWVAGGALLKRAVVNFPDTESDLRLLTEAELSAAAGTLVDNASRGKLSGLREGRPLWPWFLALAALFLLCEGVLLRVIGKSAVPPPVAPLPQEKKEVASA